MVANSVAGAFDGTSSLFQTEGYIFILEHFLNVKLTSSHGAKARLIKLNHGRGEIYCFSVSRKIKL